MVKTIDDLFTPVSELRGEFAHQRGCEPTIDTTRAISKTPVGLLEEACRKIYERAPEYSNGAETSLGTKPHFEMFCKIMEKSTRGTGKTRKAAKHEAAAEMLRVLIRKKLNYAQAMGIPCSSEEDAIKYIDGLSAELNEAKAPAAEEVDSEFDAQKNYVGAVQQLCQKEKFDNPIYEESSDGPPNDRLFTVVCTVGSQKMEGKAKQKKLAKSIAAYKMLNVLEKGLAEMKEDLLLDEGDIVDESGSEQARQEKARQICDPVKEVENALKQDTIDLKLLEYRILERRCAMSMYQCLLKIVCSRNGEAEHTDVYPGAGDTEDEAKQECARLALVHFGTF